MEGIESVLADEIDISAMFFKKIYDLTLMPKDGEMKCGESIIIFTIDPLLFPLIIKILRINGHLLLVVH